MTYPTLLILGALSSASLSVPFAYAAPQEQAPAEEDSSCACTCAACAAKHGAKAATVGDTSAPDDAVSAEIAAVREALAAVEAEMTREERVARVLATELTDVSGLLGMEPAMEEEPIIEESEPTPEELVARVLGTDLKDVDALLLGQITNFDVDLDQKASIRPEKSETLTFAVPAAPASGDQGYLGVELGEGDDGVEIANVMAGSPAAESGVQAGDVIFNIAGTTVMGMAELREVMSRFKPGDRIGFGVMRDGRPVNLTAKLADRKVLAQGTAPRVEDTVRALPAVPPAPPVPVRAKRGPRIRLVPGGEDANTRTYTITEGQPKPSKKAEVILAQPIKLPTRAREPQEVRESDTQVVPRRRARAPRAAVEAVDALPEGYVEITTRRERRPAQTEALQARIEALEAEVKALTTMLADIRRELNRRSMR